MGMGLCPFLHRVGLSILMFSLAANPIAAMTCTLTPGNNRSPLFSTDVQDQALEPAATTFTRIALSPNAAHQFFREASQEALAWFKWSMVGWVVGIGPGFLKPIKTPVQSRPGAHDAEIERILKKATEQRVAKKEIGGLLSVLKRPYNELRPFHAYLFKLADGLSGGRYLLQVCGALLDHIEKDFPEDIRLRALDAVLDSKAAAWLNQYVSYRRIADWMTSPGTSLPIQERLTRLLLTGGYSEYRRNAELLKILGHYARNPEYPTALRLAAGQALTAGEVIQLQARKLLRLEAPQFLKTALERTDFRIGIYVYDLDTLDAAKTFITQFQLPKDRVVILHQDLSLDPLIERDLVGLYGEMRLFHHQLPFDQSLQERIFIVTFNDRAMGPRRNNFWSLPKIPWEEGVMATPINEIYALQEALGLHAADPVVVLNYPNALDMDEFITHIYPPVIQAVPNVRIIVGFNDVATWETFKQRHHERLKTIPISVRTSRGDPWKPLPAGGLLAVLTTGEMLQVDGVAKVVLLGRDRKAAEALAQGKATFYFGADSDYVNTAVSFERLTRWGTILPVSPDDLIYFLLKPGVANMHKKQTQEAVKHIHNILKLEVPETLFWLSNAITAAAAKSDRLNTVLDAAETGLRHWIQKAAIQMSEDTLHDLYSLIAKALSVAPNDAVNIGVTLLRHLNVANRIAAPASPLTLRLAALAA